MADHDEHIRLLKSQIATLEAQLQHLRNDLAAARANTATTPSASSPSEPRYLGREGHIADDSRQGDEQFFDAYGSEILSALAQPITEPPNHWPLGHDEYVRYGRQLIMPEIGLSGQLRLKSAKVLVVGVGGLGCPAAMYLAGAGVGMLGLVDGDDVETSNLHRQILHRDHAVGKSKVESAIEGLRQLNPLTKYVPHRTHLRSDNALEIFAQYDLVLDCTDNPATRYLISDTCVLLGKPLISASALRTEGQLMVLNNPARPSGVPGGGPCYRCVFPKPPPVDSVVTCGEGGILGPVVGVMGVLQALEAIKVITAEETSTDPSLPGLSPVTTSAFAKSSLNPPNLLIFSAYSNPQFRSIKLRSRSPKCAACSSQAIITPEALLSGSMDYVQFCGVANPVNVLSPDERISATEYAEARKNISLTASQHRLIDVREKVQYDLCHLFGSINVPFSRLNTLNAGAADHDTLDVIDELRGYIARSDGSGQDPVLVVCRLGNDSQIAVRKFKELGLDDGGKVWIGDIQGGLKAWRQEVDPSFPDY